MLSSWVRYKLLTRERSTFACRACRYCTWSVFILLLYFSRITWLYLSRLNWFHGPVLRLCKRGRTNVGSTLKVAVDIVEYANNLALIVRNIADEFFLMSRRLSFFWRVNVVFMQIIMAWMFSLPRKRRFYAFAKCRFFILLDRMIKTKLNKIKRM